MPASVAPTAQRKRQRSPSASRTSATYNHSRIHQERPRPPTEPLFFICLTRLPDLVDRLFQESLVAPSFFDRGMFGGGAGSRPTWPVNLFETADGYIMHLALPGLKPENLDIQVVGREVSVKGKLEVSKPENGTWIWQGIQSGEFYETFTLPVEIDGDHTEAGFDYGILTISLPKAEHVKPKNIKVSVTS